MASNARQIAALVPMPVLLVSLGFVANERTRRGPCFIHGGSNPTAFVWTDTGLWKCHSCGAGGDKIALVRAVRQCSFRDALQCLAVLAGVEIRINRLSRCELEHIKREQKVSRKYASVALAVDSLSWCETRDTLLQLEAMRRNAGRRLKELFEGSPERWCGETEWCWVGLVEVARQLPQAAAAYAIASFGKFQDRLRFALDPAAAKQLIGEALDNGYVADEHGRRFEVSP